MASISCPSLVGPIRRWKRKAAQKMQVMPKKKGTLRKSGPVLAPTTIAEKNTAKVSE